MKKTLCFMAALIGGAIIGGALGILFAPESVDETHKKIQDALEKNGVKLSKKDMYNLVDDISSRVGAER